MDKRSFSSRDENAFRGSFDEPPMSRLFIICNRNNTEEQFKKAFSAFGAMEDVWVVRDRNSGDSKGIAYIKYGKTSDAAKALEQMNGKSLDDDDERPLKVLVAANRHSGNRRPTDNEEEKYLRLFVVIPKVATESDLRSEFEKWGDVDEVTIIKEKGTGQPKGFGYVKYNRFLHAATAFENCPAKYKAVFAEPKGSRRDGDRDRGRDRSREGGFSRDDNFSGRHNESLSSFSKIQQSCPNQPTTLEVTCSSFVNQDQLWRLFDIIPGLDYCQITGESSRKSNSATVVYTSPDAAGYAREKLHGLEYPPGERLIVKMASNSNNERCKEAAFCSVDLPPTQPLEHIDSTVAKRLFIVAASSLPNQILKNVFCTFGNLIEVYLLPNKNFGYAKFSREESANDAIEKLHGAEIYGVRLKVMEAQEHNEDNRKRMRRD